MAEDIVPIYSTTNFRIIFGIVIVLLVILIAPFAYRFDVGPGPDSIEAIIWHYIEAPWHTGFRLQDPFRYFPYIFIRMLFLVQFIRYAMGKASQKVTLLVAAYSELHVGLLSLPVLISWYFDLGLFSAPDGDPFLPIFFPLPILFLLVALVLFIDRRRSY
ncbi:MAG: hypothetical protein RTU63_02700 [Candidatus Thorarchaeota archaeon]